jgi:hypothetical protein
MATFCRVDVLSRRRFVEKRVVCEPLTLHRHVPVCPKFQKFIFITIKTIVAGRSYRLFSLFQLSEKRNELLLFCSHNLPPESFQYRIRKLTTLIMEGTIYTFQVNKLRREALLLSTHLTTNYLILLKG